MFNSFPQPKPDSGGGSNIKSIQSGEINFPSANLSTTVTISPVDVNKSIVMISSYSLTSPLTSDKICVAAEITDSTTLTFTRTASGAALTLFYEVIEHVNVKSLQKGTKTISSANDSVVVSPVNPKKSLVYATSTDANTADTNTGQFEFSIFNSTTIKFNQVSVVTKTIKWQLIEFP